MTNPTPQAELVDLKKQILAAMSDYMQTFENTDVDIPLNLTACEAALKKHLDGVVLDSALAAPAAIVHQLWWALHSLSREGFNDMLMGTSPPPDAQTQQAFWEECRKVIDLSFADLLVPAVKEDLPKVMGALGQAMLALAFVSMDAICDDVHRKAPGYHPYVYTKAELAQCDAILTHYLEVVHSAPVRNAPEKIMTAVQIAVEALNDLNTRCGRSLIETDAREEICALIERAAQSAGLVCDGDITDEWRDW